MRKFYLLVGMWVALFNAKAQETATFDDYPLGNDSVYYGTDGAGGFYSSDIWFPIDKDPQSDYWTGFALSMKTDTVKAGYENMFSAITAGGADNSSNYAVVYIDTELNLVLDKPVILDGLYITNSVYAYKDMMTGSGFTKKFGGEDGSEPDYFKAIITGIDEAGNEMGQVEFYLADFRFENPEEDYIVDAWVWLDLSSLEMVNELKFTLESSDSGDFGINTPKYFCIDNFTVSGTTSASNPLANKQADIITYPNPVKKDFYVNIPADSKMLTVTDGTGRILFTETVTGQKKMYVSALSGEPSGIYFLQINTEAGLRTKKIIKY